MLVISSLEVDLPLDTIVGSIALVYVSARQFEVTKIEITDFRNNVDPWSKRQGGINIPMRRFIFSSSASDVNLV
jgi:CRISPR/Cas system endoribonuclease Cas6 (RAMP superfamily)